MQYQLAASEAEIDRLRGELAYATHIHNEQAALLKQAEQARLLPVQMTDNVPDDGTYISLRAAQKNEARLKAARANDREFLLAVSDLRVLVAHIDAAAAGYSNGRLKEALFDTRMDDKLLVALNGVRRTLGSDTSQSFNDLMRLAIRYVTDRIEGIQDIQHDNGNQLRNVVAESSDEWGALAQEMIDKNKQGPQGPTPETERLAEYAHQAKYTGRQTWEQAAFSILSMLRTNCRDDIDRSISNELEYRLQQHGHQGLGAYVKNTYHGHEARNRKNVS